MASEHDSDLDKIAVNQASWDERVPIHVGSAFYDVEGFKAGRVTIEPFELDEIGPVDGLDLVHLQCHFGMDAMSFARLGAQVTGVDFSAPAVDAANALAAELGLDARFVCADVYDAPAALDARQFDLVYTGLGALNWLPDLARWAGVVDALLRPGGTFYLAEFHPVQNVFADDDLVAVLPYFGPRHGEQWHDEGSYADPAAVTEHNETWEWTHPVSSVISALLDRGLVLELFHEHAHTLWGRWPFLEVHDDGTYHLPADRPSLPLMYSIRMGKRL